jgi:hypothetical protein
MRIRRRRADGPKGHPATRASAGAAACVAVAVLACTRAVCADGSLVVIVRERGADAVVERAEVRLAAELRAAGFTVDEQTAEGADDARRLVEEADARAPFATVLLRRARTGAATDVWVADHVTHKTVVRRMSARGAGDAADRGLALRVVELMRASLVEGLVLPPSSEDEPEAAPPAPSPSLSPPPADVAAWTREAVREPPPREAGSVDVAVGVAGAFAGPDVGLAVAPELRVAWRPSRAWSLAVLGALPAFGARVSASQGDATVRQELAVLEAAFEPALVDWIRPYIAAGGGFYHLDATGYASAPYTSGAADAWSALLSAGLGARLPLTGSAWLALDVRELFALPRPVVSFAGETVAVAMRPGTLAGLTLAVTLR